MATQELLRMQIEGSPAALREVADWLMKVASELDHFATHMLRVLARELVWTTTDAVAVIRQASAEAGVAEQHARELEESAKLTYQAADAMETLRADLAEIAAIARSYELVEPEEKSFLQPDWFDEATFGPVRGEVGSYAEYSEEYEEARAEVYERKRRSFEEIKAMVMNAVHPVLVSIAGLDKKRDRLSRDLAYAAGDLAIGGIKKLADERGPGLFQRVMRGAPLYSVAGAAHAIYDSDGVVKVAMSHGSGYAAGVLTAAGGTRLIGSASVPANMAGPLGWGVLVLGVLVTLAFASGASGAYERTFETESPFDKLDRLARSE